MKEYIDDETIIEIVIRENTKSSDTQRFDVYLDGKFIDGGIMTDTKNIPDVLGFVSRFMNVGKR
ncbi:hypothetical protein [uncultured Mediterranean phage uvMED]|nr:hypothetical protein [uncultured Mediterranean phage uvMED]|tara:strand:- start:1875 stop:2066 length:192 start_codon:yes stop_codon:yes gene_type:complete